MQKVFIELRLVALRWLSRPNISLQELLEFNSPISNLVLTTQLHKQTKDFIHMSTGSERDTVNKNTV